MAVAQALAERIHKAASNLRDDSIEAAKFRLADGLAIIISGSNTPIAQLVRKYVMNARRQIARDDVGLEVFPTCDLTLPFEDAGFVSGTYAFSENYADTSLQSVSHPGSVVVPAILTASQLRPTSGRDVLAAIIAGYEALETIARALNSPKPRMKIQLRGVRPTTSCGPIGVAAALAVLWDFNVATTRNAIGIAADRFGGLRRQLRHRESSILIHSGEAVRAGMAASTLADVGVVSDPDVFEGQGGFFAALGADNLDQAVLQSLDGVPTNLAEDICLKIHCTPHTLATTLDVVLQLGAEIDVHDVKRIEVQVPRAHAAISSSSGIPPTSSLEGAADYGLAAAIVLATGEPLWPDQLKSNINDPIVQHLASLVEVEADNEDINRLFENDRDSWPAHVTIDLLSGQRIEGGLTRPQTVGIDLPARALLRRKFDHCIRDSNMSPATADLWKFIEGVQAVDDFYASLRSLADND